MSGNTLKGAGKAVLHVLSRTGAPGRHGTMWLRPPRPTLGTRVEYKPTGGDLPWREGVVVACENACLYVEAR